MLGISKKQAVANIGEITDFTELGKFIDAPLKTYSLGMIMRLLFAVATSGHPEILLLDEIISVGDSRFQQKATDRIQKLMSRTSIVILASHSREVIEAHCNRCVVLNKSRIVGDFIF